MIVVAIVRSFSRYGLSCLLSVQVLVLGCISHVLMETDVSKISLYGRFDASLLRSGKLLSSTMDILFYGVCY